MEIPQVVDAVGSSFVAALICRVAVVSTPFLLKASPPPSTPRHSRGSFSAPFYRCCFASPVRFGTELCRHAFHRTTDPLFFRSPSKMGTYTRHILHLIKKFYMFRHPSVPSPYGLATTPCAKEMPVALSPW